MPKKNLLILKRQITRTIHYVNIFKFGILEVIVCSCTLFMPLLPLLLTYFTDILLLLCGRIANTKTATSLAAQLWSSYLSLWHSHSIDGLDNIPAEGPALIVWYHGPVPVDYMGLVARIYLSSGRKVWSVVDKVLQHVPGLEMFRSHLRCGSYSKVSVAGLLQAGELVGVSPGGAREGLFDHDLDLMWQRRTGFAKVGQLTQSPIIPVYTENIRLAYRTLQTGHSVFRFLFETTRWPFVPFYGGFPVCLVTHVGSPVLPRPGETVDQLHQRVTLAMRNIMLQHRGHQSVTEALGDRLNMFNKV